MAYALHYGKSRKVLARVVSDEKYPTMWRIHWPDGEISDMVNLSRARDAAAILATRRYPELQRKTDGLRWEMAQPRAEASPMRQTARRVSDIG